MGWLCPSINKTTYRLRQKDGSNAVSKILSHVIIFLNNSVLNIKIKFQENNRANFLFTDPDAHQTCKFSPIPYSGDPLSWQWNVSLQYEQKNGLRAFGNKVTCFPNKRRLNLDSFIFQKTISTSIAEIVFICMWLFKSCSADSLLLI